MIDFLKPILSIVLTVIILCLLATKIKKDSDTLLIRSLDEEEITIHYSVVYRWVGIVCAIFFLCLIIFMTVFPNGSAELCVYLIFSLFVILGLYLILESYLWKIKVNKREDYYDLISSFGRKYRVFYAEIIHYKVGDNFIKIKTNKKVFYVDTKALNLEYLLQMLKKNKVKEVIKRK